MSSHGMKITDPVVGLMLQAFIENGNEPMTLREWMYKVYPLKNEVQAMAFNLGRAALFESGALVTVYHALQPTLYWVKPAVFEGAKEVAWEWHKMDIDTGL